MKTIMLTQDSLLRGSLLLINARHPLPQSVAPDRLTPFFGSGVLLERRTALVLENLFTALGCGASLIPVSGYRTLTEQKQIYASSLERHGEEFTRDYVALPDCSEHQTGLAIDLALNREPVDFIRPYFPEDGVCGRFREKMISYGFIQRYRGGTLAFPLCGNPSRGSHERKGPLSGRIHRLSQSLSSGRPSPGNRNTEQKL